MTSNLSPFGCFFILTANLWNLLKNGTQIGYQMSPAGFFSARIFIPIYNLLLLLFIWYKFR